MVEFEKSQQEDGGINSQQNEALFSGGYSERRRYQPYRSELQSFLASHHARLTPQNEVHPDAHGVVELVERNASEFLSSSDRASGFVSSPEFQSISQRQKKELRGKCSIGLFICIDGRLVPIIIGSPVFDISETKAGLVPVSYSQLDGELELTNPRIVESISDRPLKESPQILQISSGHYDSSKPGAVDCYAVKLMVDQGKLPNDGSHDEKFREMLASTGVAVGATFNRSAKAKGFDTLENVGLTASFDTRTSGFIVDGSDGDLNTTRLTKSLMSDLSISQRLGQPGLYRRDFTDPATLIAREYSMYNIEKILMRQSKTFKLHVDSFTEKNMAGYTENQIQAFNFFVARTVASQIITGLYQGGEHPFASHNEQYISSSTNGLRVGQNDTKIQSFGANVANYDDSVSHLETKVMLADKIGKMKSPYVAFISESSQEKTSPSTDRNTRAKLRSHMKAVMESPDLLSRIKAGELWVVPVILQEKTGIVKSIPNLAI